MIAVAIVATAAALAVALWFERARVRAVRQVDQMAASLRDDVGVRSDSMNSALDRLERAAQDRATAPQVDAAEARRYRASLSSITLGVVLVDQEGRRVFDNPYAAAFLAGRHGDAVVGDTVDQLTTEALVSGATAVQEVQLFGPPRKTLHVIANPIVDGDQHLGVVVLIDDVTEQERLDAIRRDFVANISHELRTPIGAISLLAETLADEPDPAVASSLADRLSSEAHRLTGTIDDLLQLSRIEHGADDDFVPVVIQQVIARAVDRVRAAADQRDVEIGVQLPERELLVRGDDLQLTSAIANLIDNGIKYTNAAEGVLSVRARDAGEHIEIVVQDNGIGIPPKDRDRIFERFYRVDRGRSRSSGGTGLGLAIVRHVLVNHGGRISVDSTEGDGTTFTIELPALGGVQDQPEPTLPEASNRPEPHRKPKGGQS